MQYAALVDEDAAALARAIGTRVRQERKGRELTLEQLANAAGVSRRMLVSVEQGTVNPSVGTLLRLSEALGVGLPTLVEPPATKAVRVTRCGEGATLWTGVHGGTGVLLAATESPDVVELWDWTLAPAERHASKAHAAGTRELLQVQTGTVSLEIDGETHVLASGDAIAFHGDVDHAYANPHGNAARFSLTVFEPGVGTSHHGLNAVTQ